ncbi:hypothetical protein [Dietzia sp. ANT_WB102]|uniref:hypothetical protein n=1 Tax=Dietzia sp. ANT_WB102 TaxID=2597345 RepID=UPI0011EFA82E|nr:hypothetical protein [Dietzia sp. ANT_WB102]KAA0919953.1 hypothetical protein FQ137_05110 [Dietzia sp. ANT_WB102]
MDDLTERSVAERVRTVLARGAAGTVEAGVLRRPLRSARVRDDGVVVLVVDVAGVSRDAGNADRVVGTGAAATVEIVDTVCTGRCRSSASRPSFALDGRAASGSERDGECDDECAVARGVVTLSGIVTASSAARRRRLVTADGGGAGSTGEGGTLQLSELQPLEITYLTSDGVHMVARADLAAAAVDPIGVDEQVWLRRLASDAGLAARLALRAGRQIAGTQPRIVAIDRRGIDLMIGSTAGVFGERVRLPFAQVCSNSDEVLAELATLSS